MTTEVTLLRWFMMHQKCT